MSNRINHRYLSCLFSIRWRFSIGGGITALALALLVPVSLHAQAAPDSAYALPSAAPATPTGANEEARGRTLLDQMVQALGGDAWLNKVNMQADGRGTSFFHGEPNPYVSEYHTAVRYARPNAAPPIEYASRTGFLTDRGMVVPGKKIDVVQMSIGRKGYEITYKGKIEPPQKFVDDVNRTRDHSIAAVVNDWIHAPGVMIIYEGRKFIDRHQADQVSVLSASNDAVTIYLDATTHLPIRSSFQYRDPEFHDLDEESQTYDDYHPIQGIATPLTTTGYLNGDMKSESFLTKVTYNVDLPADFFDPDAVAAKLVKVKK